MPGQPKKISPDVQKEIEEAIDQIPQMINGQDNIKEKKLVYTKEKDNAKLNVLWISVISIMIMIVVMWVWNIRVLFYKADTESPNYSNLIKNIKDDFSSALYTSELKETVSTTKKIAETLSQKEETNTSTIDFIKNTAKNLINGSATSTTSTMEQNSTSTFTTNTPLMR